MLYKKYHRSYVKQFRRGKKVIRFGCDVSHKATITGLVISRRDTFNTYIAIETADKCIVPLVYWSGQLVREIDAV